MKSIEINIAGDTFLGRTVEKIAIDNPSKLFSQEVGQLFRRADFNILNLESPLTVADRFHKISKTGPNLKASPDTVGVLQELQIDLVTLANNHIFDFGEQGLTDTLELCHNKNIKTVGAGLDLVKASTFFVTEVEGKRICVINVAENEWCNASIDRGGANPLNVIENLRTLKKAKAIADVVIMIIHGGHEQYYYPSPRMVELYRFYAEQGASIVVGHHSHCISGYEVYKDVPIFYSLGNFLFASNTSFEGWFEGLILNLIIDKENNIKWTLYPISQCKREVTVELLNSMEQIEFYKKIERINDSIADLKKLRERFDTYVSERSKFVLSTFSNANIIKSSVIRRGITKLGLDSLFLRKTQLKVVQNLIQCESHRDITYSAISRYLSKKS